VRALRSLDAARAVKAALTRCVVPAAPVDDHVPGKRTTATEDAPVRQDLAFTGTAAKGTAGASSTSGRVSADASRVAAEDEATAARLLVQGGRVVLGPPVGGAAVAQLLDGRSFRLLLPPDNLGHEDVTAGESGLLAQPVRIVRAPPPPPPGAPLSFDYERPWEASSAATTATVVTSVPATAGVSNATDLSATVAAATVTTATAAAAIVGSVTTNATTAGRDAGVVGRALSWLPSGREGTELAAFNRRVDRLRRARWPFCPKCASRRCEAAAEVAADAMDAGNNGDDDDDVHGEDEGDEDEVEETAEFFETETALREHMEACCPEVQNY